MRAGGARLLVLTALASCSVGCVTASKSLARDWLPDSELTYDPAQHPDAKAVVVYRGDFLLMYYENKAVARSQVSRHEAIALQSEGAYALAEVRVPFGADDTLLELKARIRDPSGRTEEVDAKSILSDLSGSGERDLNAKFLRIPNVKIGSVLEYLYVIQQNGFHWYGSQETMGENPVKRYDLELRYPKEMIIEAKEYNSRAPIRIERDDDFDSWKMSCTLTDLPGRERDEDAPIGRSSSLAGSGASSRFNSRNAPKRRCAPGVAA